MAIAENNFAAAHSLRVGLISRIHLLSVALSISITLSLSTLTHMYSLSHTHIHTHARTFSLVLFSPFDIAAMEAAKLPVDEQLPPALLESDDGAAEGIGASEAEDDEPSHRMYRSFTYMTCCLFIY